MNKDSIFENKFKLMVINQNFDMVRLMINSNPVKAAKTSQNGLLEFSKGLIV